MSLGPQAGCTRTFVTVLSLATSSFCRGDSLRTTAAWTSPWPPLPLAETASINCSLSYWRKKWPLRGG